ncbi:MAG: leucine-rich repeat domain-containing protein [Nostoc sp.]|uniref:leucine-rich repeat domain-containing protein n=1 Tax=Nostoc sp. TaxID=1180 RepID=UPI002FF08B6F
MTNEELLQIIKQAVRDKVTTLKLFGKDLTKLPPEIGQLTNLQTLSLYNNELSSLPPEIGQLTNLQTLNLYNNELSSLPPEFGQLTNLQTLNLSRNQLSSLPPEFGQLTNLLKDMNTLTPDIHSESDFEILLNAIAHRLDE